MLSRFRTYKNIVKVLNNVNSQCRIDSCMLIDELKVQRSYQACPDYMESKAAAVGPVTNNTCCDTTWTCHVEVEPCNWYYISIACSVWGTCRKRFGISWSSCSYLLLYAWKAKGIPPWLQASIACALCERGRRFQVCFCLKQAAVGVCWNKLQISAVL